MPADGLQLLMAMLGGNGANLKDVALGFMLPQLPKIAKGFTTAGISPEGAGVPAVPQGGAAGTPPSGASAGIPPQLLPFLALAARAANQPGGPMARPPLPPAVSPAIPRVAPMDTAM